MLSTRKERLEALYRKYNRRKYVHPDPLEFLYDYPDPGDREVVGMVAASLAYGRVKQILKSVAAILGPMGPSPRRFVTETSDDGMYAAFGGFVHRFATGNDVARLLAGIRELIVRHGSLQAAFRSCMSPDHDTVLPALEGFCCQIAAASGGDPGHLLPLPERGSACKRMNLFLRWMVRKDAVDPGGWSDIPRESLIVPLDVHMFRIGRELGFTSRKQANMKAALEITRGFGEMVPEDPVRYDFVLTRPGIRGDMGGIEFVV